MRTIAFATTDTGRARDRNEDAYALDLEGGAYVVCDGLGGHAAGEFASRTAVEVVLEHLARSRALLRDAETSEGGRFAVRVLVAGAIKEASRRLHELASTNAVYAGMGTTMTLALAWSGKLVVGHVGDCRLYLSRGGEVQRLTTDHTVAAELVLRGELTPEEAAESPLSSSLTRCVGGQPSVLVETLCLDVMPGDTFLLCTDGLHGYLEDAELGAQLGRSDLDGVPPALVELANERGGEDNITALVLRATAEESPLASEAVRVGQRLSALAAVPLFRDLALPRLTRVLEAMEVRSYARGEVLLVASEELDGLYVLVHGDVAGLGSVQGHFSDPGALTRSCPARELRASEDSEVLFLGRTAFQRLARTQPRLACQLLWKLASER